MAIPISGRTGLLVILADPVEQTRAPALVNAALVARGCDAVLLPMHVRAGDLARVVGALRTVQNFKGCVVSMPHKETLLDLLDEVTPEGRQVGACNTVRRESDGGLTGTMFDGEGFVSGLRSAGHDVAGRRVFMAGAGGAAAGIAFAVAKYGATALTIHNRTAARAEALAARVRAAYPRTAVAVGGANPAGHDVVVNATSVGMRPGVGLPLDPAGLGPGALAAEVVITPETTRFLAEAGNRGATVHFGKKMLEAQIDLMVDFIRP